MRSACSPTCGMMCALCATQTNRSTNIFNKKNRKLIIRSWSWENSSNVFRQTTTTTNVIGVKKRVVYELRQHMKWNSVQSYQEDLCALSLNASIQWTRRTVFKNCVSNLWDLFCTKFAFDLFNMACGRTVRWKSFNIACCIVCSSTTLRFGMCNMSEMSPLSLMTDTNTRSLTYSLATSTE